MVDLLNQSLVALGLYSVFVLVYTILGAYHNINIWSMRWDWKKWANGLAKWLLLGFSVIATVLGVAVLFSYADRWGVDIPQAQAVSSKAIFAVMVTGCFTMVAKITQKLAGIFGVSKELLEAIQTKAIEAEDKPLVLEIADLPKLPEEYLKRKAEVEQIGGQGAVYSVPTNSYDAFRSAVIGRGFDIDGAYGFQCLTAGHLVSMADGSLRAVEYLEIGDIVKGGNKVISNEVKSSRITKVKTSMGTFYTTPDHRFILEDNRTAEARYLKKGDVITLNNVEPQKQFELSDDELRFLGFYLGDGTKKYRWQNSTKPEIFLTIGTIAKQFYIDSLKMSLKFRKHSNGEAGIMSLVNQDHPTLMELIHQIDGKSLPQVFTKDQYALIIEGYLMADGSANKGNSIVATSTNKSLLVSLQFGAILNGWRAILSDKQEREATNYSTTPKPIWRLTINKSFKPIAKVLSAVEMEDEGSVYVLNLDGNHLYYADNHLHHNCWDGVALLWQQFGQALITGNGAARGCWELNRDRNANPHFELIFDKTQIKAGDALFFAGSRWGHTGFADEDYNGSNYIKCLGQNQRGNGSGHPFTVDNISLSNFLGAMRLKKWSKTPNKAPTSPAEVKDGSKPVPAPQNAVEGLKTGDTVVPISLVDYYGTELTQYDPSYTIIELIGDRAVLSARGQVWAAMKVDNLRKV